MLAVISYAVKAPVTSHQGAGNLADALELALRAALAQDPTDGAVVQTRLLVDDRPPVTEHDF
jgi:hypothetical protein